MPADRFLSRISIYHASLCVCFRCYNRARARARAGQEEQEGEGTSLDSKAFSVPNACLLSGINRQNADPFSSCRTLSFEQKQKKQKKEKKSKKADSDDDISGDDDDGDVSGDEEIDTSLIITGGRGGRRKAAINYADFGPDDDSE